MRPHPVRLLAALVVLSLPLGWIGRAWLSAPLAVPLALALLVVPLWSGLRRHDDSAPALAATVRASLVVLAGLGMARGLGLGPDGAGWLLCVVVALVVLFGPAAPVRRSIRGNAAPWLLAVVLVAVVLYRPLDLTLSSDAPAHVAAVLDARAAGTLQPPDVHPGAGAGSVDPRFGVLHGFYATIAGWSAASAAHTLRWSALILSPLWFLAHTTLIRRLGSGPAVAAATAFVFTLYAGGGRGFGLGAAGFPGSVAQTLCAFALAALVDARTVRAALPAVALLGLSTLIHPFAWWSTTIVVGLAGLFLLLRAASRPEGRRWLGLSVASAAVGALLLVPRLLARESSAGGLHDQLNDVVLVGGGLFVADPFWIFRWGGVTSVFALPALLLVALLAPRWIRRREHLVGVALATPVWLIALNPLLAPPAWSMVSYLVVRLGRIVLTTWVWVTAIQQGLMRWQTGGRSILAGAVLVLLGLTGLRHEVSTALLHLRQPQVIDVAGASTHLDEIATGLGTVHARWLLAAPRIGYGLRARGGPPLVLTPVAHASPNDRDLLDRLARWRELHDPALDDDELRRRLGEFGDAVLLVDAWTRTLHSGLNEYAYVPDRERALALDARLRALGVEVLAEGKNWTLFRLPDAGPPPEPAPWTGPVGLPFTVESVRLEARTARPGDRVPLHLDLVATGARAPFPQRIFVRLEGAMPEAPAGLGGVSKLWRKLVVERSGRSENRFGQWVVPADLVVPTERWPGGRWDQTALLRIPAWAEPGEYSVQVTVHDWIWHGHRDLGDYLRDTDRFSAPPRAALRVVGD